MRRLILIADADREAADLVLAGAGFGPNTFTLDVQRGGETRAACEWSGLTPETLTAIETALSPFAPIYIEDGWGEWALEVPDSEPWGAPLRGDDRCPMIPSAARTTSTA